MPRRILIIEDEAALASALALLVKRIGEEPMTAASAALGLELVAQHEPALVILDIGLPDLNGLEALARIRAHDTALPVLVITAHGNLENAVEAKKRGASGYLVKPLDLRELEDTLRMLLEAPAVDATQVSTGPRNLETPVLIGSSPAMQPAFAAIAHACTSDAPVLITGPTGIGKSVTAHIIHRHSRRHAAPFVTLSCATLPETLLEAELFGHEKGAFTGANATRAGHIERAAGGTLFLEEIAEIPPAVQVKVLRFVEDKVFSRVGGREDLRVNLRIIAATNQDLGVAVAEKRFREDLLYRLRVLEVKLPPLRDRSGDLPALCAYLLAGIARDRRLALSADVLGILRAYPWPGNVRELRNVLEHAAAVCAGPVVLPAHLPAELRNATGSGRPALEGVLNAALEEWLEARFREGLRDGVTYEALHAELEGKLLAALLERFEGKPTVLARELGMNRATLRKKLRSMQDDEGLE